MEGSIPELNWEKSFYFLFWFPKLLPFLRKNLSLPWSSTQSFLLKIWKSWDACMNFNPWPDRWCFGRGTEDQIINCSASTEISETKLHQKWQWPNPSQFLQHRSWICPSTIYGCSYEKVVSSPLPVGPLPRLWTNCTQELLYIHDCL